MDNYEGKQLKFETDELSNYVIMSQWISTNWNST